MDSLISTEHPSLSKGFIPTWVKPCDFLLEPLSLKPSQINIQYLLIDTQQHWSEQSIYCHYAIKALTQIGISYITPIKVNFDPSYQQVIFHMIRVSRNGLWSDRLESARYSLLQREGELEQNVYNGDFCVVYFPNDIRVGDVLEFSYSIRGRNPLFSTHYTDFLHLQFPSIIEKISHRFLSDPNHSFHMKPFNVKLEPKIVDLSTTLREWSFEILESSSLVYEEGTPSWYIPVAHIQISQYKSWYEVSQKINPYFVLPHDLEANPSSEMIELVRKWKEASQDNTKLALLALRFVQDEVRYFGFEDGIGSFKPNDPRIVLERRFGDCKDKHIFFVPSLNYWVLNQCRFRCYLNYFQLLPHLIMLF